MAKHPQSQPEQPKARTILIETQDPTTGRTCGTFVNPPSPKLAHLLCRASAALSDRSPLVPVLADCVRGIVEGKDPMSIRDTLIMVGDVLALDVHSPEAARDVAAALAELG